MTDTAATDQEPWIKGWLLEHVVEELDGDTVTAKRVLGVVWEHLITTTDEIAGHELIFAGEGRGTLWLHEPEHVRDWIKRAICGDDDD